MLSTVGRLFTQNIGDYFMLSTVRRFIYTKYWGILYVEHCGKIYLHRILGITSCWTLWEYLFTQNTGDYFMWEDLFTQHTEEYCMLSTVGRFMYTQYWGILYVEHYGKNYLHKILGITLCWTRWEDYLHKIFGNTLCWTLGRFIYIKFWEILYVEHCGTIYLHQILRNTLCWTLGIFI